MGLVERFVGGTEVGSGTELSTYKYCCSPRNGLGTRSALKDGETTQGWVTFLKEAKTPSRSTPTTLAQYQGCDSASFPDIVEYKIRMFDFSTGQIDTALHKSITKPHTITIHHSNPTRVRTARYGKLPYGTIL